MHRHPAEPILPRSGSEAPWWLYDMSMCHRAPEPAPPEDDPRIKLPPPEDDPPQA